MSEQFVNIGKVSWVLRVLLAGWGEDSGSRLLLHPRTKGWYLYTARGQEGTLFCPVTRTGINLCFSQ